MGETGHVYRTAYPSCEVQILTRNVLIMGRRLLSGDVIAHTKETNAPLSDYKQYFMEVCNLSFNKIIDGTAMIQRVKGLYERGQVDLSYFHIVREAVQMEPPVKTHTPIEPMFTPEIEPDMSHWDCGACGAFIWGNAYPGASKDSRPKYCSHCGQAVKWE